MQPEEVAPVERHHGAAFRGRVSDNGRIVASLPPASCTGQGRVQGFLAQRRLEGIADIVVAQPKLPAAADQIPGHVAVVVLDHARFILPKGALDLFRMFGGRGPSSRQVVLGQFRQRMPDVLIGLSVPFALDQSPDGDARVANAGIPSAAPWFSRDHLLLAPALVVSGPGFNLHRSPKPHNPAAAVAQIDTGHWTK
jgi:hypothetical protein